MRQGNPLYPIQDIIQKTRQPFYSFTLNLWHKKLHGIISHDEGLVALRKCLESREDRTISTDSLMDLTECVIKNHIFEYNFLRGTAIGTKMAPPYAIIFMEDLEE